MFEKTSGLLSQRLQAALALSPFRQQFDNFASLISLDTDSASGLTFEIFAQNLTENLLGALKENEKTGRPLGWTMISLDACPEPVLAKSWLFHEETSLT